MPYQGTFARHEPGNYGGKIVVQTQKGEWTLDNNTPQGTAMPAPGTPVSFEAEKKGNYWKCKSITPQGGAPQHASQPQGQPAYSPPPAGIGTHNDPKALEIFVTGVIGRCFHGTGQLPGRDVLSSMVRACAEAWRDGLTPQDGGDPGPSGPDDYYN